MVTHQIGGEASADQGSAGLPTIQTHHVLDCHRAWDEDFKPCPIVCVAYAAAAGDVEEVRRIIQWNPAVLEEQEGWDYNTAVGVCVEWGKLDALRMLLDEGGGVGINSRSGLGETPLHIAIDKSDAAAAQLLLERGADASASCKYTPDHPHAADLQERQVRAGHHQSSLGAGLR
jgi:hypothetical protein